MERHRLIIHTPAVATKKTVVGVLNHLTGTEKNHIQAGNVSDEATDLQAAESRAGGSLALTSGLRQRLGVVLHRLQRGEKRI